ncbi:MAG: outer membrane protein assembly factor BamD, partial [Tabrizicola sp.]|nr:outer membrane protein assembly factor BamD [Tabrizicola sp.]
MSGTKPCAGFLKAALLVVMVAGCSGRAQKQPVEAQSAEEIYKLGELELETGKRPKDALVYFQEVERLYPYTEYAKRALIMQAYTHHKAKEYPEA